MPAVNFAPQPGSAALIERIYGAALDPSQWTEFLWGFASALGSHGAIIWANDFSSGTAEIAHPGDSLFTSLGFGAAELASFTNYYAQKNVWLEDPRMHVGGTVVNSSALFPDERLKRTEYWGDWLRPQDIFYSAAAVVEKRNDRSMNVTVVRSERAGRYTDAELALIGELIPHLKTGFALHRKLHRLDALVNATVGVMERVPFGVALIDESGQVMHMNTAASTLIEQSANVLQVSSNAFHCARASDEAKLAHLVASSVRTGSAKPGEAGSAGGGMRLSALDGAQIHLFIAPLPSWSSPFGERCAAAVFLSRPTSIFASLLASLRAAHGMTLAEARLTEALVNGLSPREYAEAQGLSLNTVRTQIKTAAAKVGASRQMDLVRAVLTGPAVLMAPQG